MRRQAQGKSAEYLAGQSEEARWWERQAGRVEDSGSAASEEASERERLVELVRARGLAVNDVAQEKVQQSRRERQMRGSQRQVQVQVGISPQTEQRLVALAAGLGVGVERLLGVLADSVESGGDGLVQVAGVAVAPGPRNPH
ncbi:hypothetical protein [Kitasatospora sp. MBT63]|uniref:hypothetical protein n=1 Tax=Kitasatospora sp. MBT63 TaxID=1444768 RepID=UPI0011EA62E6|nr:hypothetical protein [Kitasatospora sp. MBT63]